VSNISVGFFEPRTLLSSAEGGSDDGGGGWRNPVQKPEGMRALEAEKP